ncbi:hypothetical protein [Sphingomonas hankookensis]|uniref:hypothetical protein n=1 Tax=Sphingomonas hankookensis TaxID=563996 RepID=UPI003F79FA2E
MIALATSALFASAAALAVTTIVATIAPHRVRIVRLLLEGPEWALGTKDFV